MTLTDFDHFKAKEPYYTGYRLLSTPDKNGEKPEIFISTSNRSAGKTVFYSGYMLHRYIQHGEKFLLLYRNKYETDTAVQNFASQIINLFYAGVELTQDRGIKNVYDKIVIKAGDSAPEICGYVTSLRASEQIKKYSSMLSGVSWILFDEAFPEDDIYLPDEVRRLMSIHDSLARGGGAQNRYLPVIIIGNLINVDNPYYSALNIVDQLTIETNYMRGDGWVVEQAFNAASAQAHAQSAFHRALDRVGYGAASMEKTYLNTDYQFIENQIVDKGIYICSIKYGKHLYSVRYNESTDFYYAGTNPDPSCKYVQAATESDIDDAAIFDPLSRARKLLKKKFRDNKVRFKNLETRSAVLHFINGR